MPKTKNVERFVSRPTSNLQLPPPFCRLDNLTYRGRGILNIRLCDDHSSLGLSI